MQNNHKLQGNKWLGAIMIVLGILIALMGLIDVSGRFRGNMYHDAYPYSGYGGHMIGGHGSRAMGRGSIEAHRMGGGFMAGPAEMMSGGYMMDWFGYTHDLDLSDEQNERVEAIRAQVRNAQWELSRRLREERWQLMTLLRADSPDPAEVAKQHSRVSDLSRQMLEASLDARRRIDIVLTQDQRDDVRNRRHVWMMNLGDL